MASRKTATRLLAAGLLIAVAGCSGSGNKGRASTVLPSNSATEAPTATSGPTSSSAATPSTPGTTPTSGVALPYLNGSYRVVVVVKTSNTEKQPAGTRKVRTWKFSGGCASASCGVTLLREVGWTNANGTSTTKYFKSIANRTSTGYRGTEHKPQQCTLPSGRTNTGPEQATLNYTIQIIAGQGGARPSFRGTATNTAPAQGGCRAVTQTLTFTGMPA